MFWVWYCVTGKKDTSTAVVDIEAEVKDADWGCLDQELLTKMVERWCSKDNLVLLIDNENDDIE